MRRLGAGFLRRVAIFVAIAFSLTLAVPARVQAEGGGFPLSWLYSWALSSSASSSAFVGQGPDQEHGRLVHNGHYVGSDVTRASGGAGREPQRVSDGLAPYAPHDPQVQPGAAGNGITGFDAASSRRQQTGANARTDVFANADGSVTQKIAGGAMNFQDTDGQWYPISTRLIQRADGRWHMAANSLKVSVGATTDAGLATMSLPSGESVSYDLAGAASSRAAVQDSTALYPAVLPETDLELISSATGLKETLILRSPDAATEWVFPLRLKGLTPRIAQDGSVELADKTGKTVVFFPRGYMQDSYVDPYHGGATESTNIRYELIQHNGAPALKVIADQVWLKDPRRVYPVRVDPTATTWTTGDVFVDNNASGPDHNGDNLPVGTHDSGATKTRSFIQLDSFDDNGFTSRKISDAKLKLYLTWTYSCGTYRPFSVHAVTQAWTVAGLDAGSYPGPAISPAIGTLNTTDYSVACTNSAGNRSVGRWITVPLSVATFDNWARGGANFGLALTASETDNYAWKRFTSANYSTGQYRPHLELTYAQNVAPQVTVRYPANNFAATTLTPQLVARAHDPDNWPGTGLKYQFNVYNETGQTLIVSSGSIDSGSWTVPAGKLNWGKKYLYTVQVYDRATYSAVYPAYAFSTPVPQPQLTSRLAQNADKGFDPSIGNYTTSVTDAEVATIGPELELVRSYNSLDLRTRGALGRGWSSLLDTQVTEVKDASGALQTAVVTYPDGSEVAFGREANGSFVAPQGRFATLTGLYTLTDKDATVYRFASVGGVYKISSITDANGRALTFTYDADAMVTQIRSASGRSLFFTWSTPVGSTYPHVATVKTDPATPGVPASAQTWQYTFVNDNLSQVCDPAGRCTSYSYTSISQHGNAMKNIGPYSYWRLDEAAGATVARSGTLANSGVDNGVFSNVALGQPPALEHSTATSAGFNGTSSYVQLPGKLITDGPHQSISMWFKTIGSGVLASTQSAVVPGLTGSYQPVLYVGTDGKLYGQFWTGAIEPMVSAGAVNDGNWHQVVLSAAPGAQSLYLDGAKIGTLNKALAATTAEMVHSYLGTGRWTGRPATAGDYGYFNGSMSDAAFFGQALSEPVIADLYNVGKWPRSALTKITRPSGGVSASITYDMGTGKVSTVTDENGGVWTMRPPKIEGNSGVYASSVLGGKPADYWRLSDVPGDSEAVNEVAGGTATYNASVTLGVAGPFADAKAAGFNGTSSMIANPAPLLDTSKNFSISAWVRLTDNTRHQRAVTVAGNRVTAIWLGYNKDVNKWQSTMYQSDTDGPLSNRASSTAVAALNTWTHLITTYDATSRALKLYVNGVLQETVTVAGTKWKAAGPLYIGQDLYNGVQGNFWKGDVAEVATFGSILSPDQIAAQHAASKQSAPVAITRVADGVASIVMPVTTVGVTDPGGKDISFSYDIINGYRIVAQTDALGNTTKYGYDVGGYSSLTYDPRGVLTEEISDVRGNTLQSITCQDQAAKKCSSVYYTYYPDATSTVLTPDPRNDVMLTMRDGRSASATDNTYLTSYVYDAMGNEIEVIEPLGRKTTTTYTNGLPVKVVSPGGSVQTIEYDAKGNVTRSTDALGKVSSYTYDDLGRAVTETETTSSFPGGLTTRYTFDAMGRVLTQTEPAVTNRVTGAVHTSVTTSEYNADGFVTKQTISDTTGGDAARVVSTGYNAYGQVISETDASGGITRHEYDAYGNMVKEIEPDGGVVVNTYDAEANLLTSKVVGFTGDPNNPSSPADLVTATNVYDPAGRVASETDAQGHSTLYTYTDNGLEAKVVSTDGTRSFVVEENFYDAAGNLIKQVTDNGSTTTAFTYDAAGRQVTSTLDPAGLKRTTTFTYSPDDEVLTETETDAAGAIVGFTEALYDAEGNVVSETTYPSTALSPAGRWKMAGAADSGGNSKLTTSGNVTWATSPRTAAVLDGTSSLQTAGPVLDTARSFTVGAWAYPTDATLNSAIIAQQGEKQSGFYLKLDSIAGDKWSFVMYNGDDLASPNTYATSTSIAPLNTWTHVAAVYDGPLKQLRLYVNGVLQTTKALNPAHVPWSALGPLSIGKLKYQGTQSDFWKGQISDAQVYQKALTAAEITAVHGATAPAADAGVIRTSYLLDTEGLVISETDPLGDVTDYSYDEEARVAVTMEPAVLSEKVGGSAVLARPITTVGYNTFDEVVETKDPNGNVTVASYDAAGQLTSVTLPSHTPPGSAMPITPVSRNEYDSSGNLTKAIDELGNITLYGYDQLGRLAKQTAASGGVSKYRYDLTDNLLSVTNPSGTVINATYDHLGHRLTSTHAGFTTTYTYDASGRLGQVRSPGGVTNTFTYNAADEMLTSTDGAGGVTRYTYDGAGRLTKTQLPDNTYSTAGYDLADRVLMRSNYTAAAVLVTTESNRYNASGDVIETTDARGTKNTFTYDATGLVVQARQPISSTDTIVSSFGYDLMGNRTRFTDGRGSAFLTTYNRWNLPESQIEPATARHPDAGNRTFTTAYDAAGRAVVQVAPGGVRIENTYDNMDRLTRQTGTGAEVATADRVFGYDLSGRMTTLSGQGGTNAIAYDDRDNVLSITGPSGNSSFTYTADRRLASRADAAGITNYSYDTAGRLKTVSNADNAVDATLTYSAASLVDKVVYNSTGNSRNFVYDALHRPTSDELKTPGGASLAKISYGWDPNSNLTSKSTTGFSGSAANTYTYDLADRLASWNTRTYAYDKAGNRVTNGAQTFRYDERNRLLDAGDGTTFAYTPRGTLSETKEGTVSVPTLADAFGQVTRQYSAASSYRDYSYDGLGRVVRTGFAYTGLGNDLAADGDARYTRDPSGTLVGVATDTQKVLAWTDLHTDVVGQFTPAGTALTGSTTYDPLGKILASTGMRGNLGYQSEWTDAFTGRVNMLARWYNTSTGQFDTRDTASNNPLPDSISANRYQYGDGNPLTVTDQSGHRGINPLKTLKKLGKAAWKGTTSVISSGYRYVSGGYNYLSDRKSDLIDSGKRKYAQLKAAAKKKYTQVKAAAKKKYVAAKKYVKKHYKAAKTYVKKKYNAAKTYVKKKYKAAKKYVAKKYHQVRKNLKKAYHHYKQAGKKIVAKAKRVVKRTINTVKDAYRKTSKWVKEHKAEIAGFVVGAVVGIGCGVLIGWTGVGAVACGALAGAAGSLVTGAMKGHQGWDLAQDALVGGTVGALTGGLFSVGGAAVGSAARSAIGGSGIRNALGAAGTAARSEAGNIARGVADSGRAAAQGLRNSVRQPGLGCRHSFDPRTRVLMADGKAKAIKDVRIGDRVAAAEPSAGINAAVRTVTATHRNTDSDMAHVRVRDGLTGKVTTLRTTQHHPFWNASAGAWFYAKDLLPGTQLKIADAGEVTVVDVLSFAGVKEMLDLTVDELHTYYVFAGETPVLVHNMDGACRVHGPSALPGADPARCICRGGGGASPSPGSNGPGAALDEQLGVTPISGTHSHTEVPMNPDEILEPGSGYQPRRFKTPRGGNKSRVAESVLRFFGNIFG